MFPASSVGVCGGMDKMEECFFCGVREDQLKGTRVSFSELELSLLEKMVRRMFEALKLPPWDAFEVVTLINKVPQQVLCVTCLSAVEDLIGIETKIAELDKCVKIKALEIREAVKNAVAFTHKTGEEVMKRKFRVPILQAFECGDPQSLQHWPHIEVKLEKEDDISRNNGDNEANESSGLAETKQASQEPDISEAIVGETKQQIIDYHQKGEKTLSGTVNKAKEMADNRWGSSLAKKFIEAVACTRNRKKCRRSSPSSSSSSSSSGSSSDDPYYKRHRKNKNNRSRSRSLSSGRTRRSLISSFKTPYDPSKITGKGCGSGGNICPDSGHYLLSPSALEDWSRKRWRKLGFEKFESKTHNMNGRRSRPIQKQYWVRCIVGCVVSQMDSMNNINQHFHGKKHRHFMEQRPKYSRSRSPKPGHQRRSSP